MGVSRCTLFSTALEEEESPFGAFTVTAICPWVLSQTLSNVPLNIS